ncbi:unnamed protein product, partial [marine sediment metagenome]
MPLCGTCHNLVETGLLKIDLESRDIHVGFVGLYNLSIGVPNPPYQVEIQLHQFKDRFPEIWEVGQKQPFLLLQDGVSQAFYTECHIPAAALAPVFDLDAVLNPDDPEDPDAEEYKLNRELVEMSSMFRKMQEDAERGRPFSDIIVEFNTSYRSDQPLKVFGGQHRAKAIINAVENEKELNRLHEFKVFFALLKDQRAEISLISNTNIAITKPLLDRFGEVSSIGFRSREWAQSVDLLSSGEDFADRVVGSQRFTVQILRALVVNFYEGKKFDGSVYEALHEKV